MDRINAISAIIKADTYSKSNTNSAYINKLGSKVKVAKMVWMPENILIFYVNDCIRATLVGNQESVNKIIKSIKDENMTVDTKTLESFPFLKDAVDTAQMFSRQLVDVMA